MVLSIAIDVVVVVVLLLCYGVLGCWFAVGVCVVQLIDVFVGVVFVFVVCVCAYVFYVYMFICWPSQTHTHY